MTYLMPNMVELPPQYHTLFLRKKRLTISLIIKRLQVFYPPQYFATFRSKNRQNVAFLYPEIFRIKVSIGPFLNFFVHK